MRKLIYALAFAVVAAFAYSAPSKAAPASSVAQFQAALNTGGEIRHEAGRRRWRGGRGWRRGWGYRRHWGYRRYGWRRRYWRPRVYFYYPYYRRCWWRYGRRYCRW
ncbi:MAG: hypothetical protein NW215_13405 [Hyphomicrobiales bacterium]|nr:hypothetical protein [Hyphomicrobiales bacterium]